jgi:hypothetical protein
MAGKRPTLAAWALRIVAFIANAAAPATKL